MYNRFFKHPAILLVCLFFLGCEGREDEQEILNILEQIEKGLERENAKDLMKHTTMDFIAHPGKLNRWSSTKQLYLLFRKHGPFSALHPIPEIDLDETAQGASVSMPFIIVAAGVTSAALEELADDPDAWTEYAEKHTEVHRLELSLIKKGDRWLAESAGFL
ncbi:MAG: hypothetical protein GY854_18460 [Deltaproteobacteria bacterium]|nr:hypothetical protein [Deltaproteobacteria bacterium]